VNVEHERCPPLQMKGHKGGISGGQRGEGGARKKGMGAERSFMGVHGEGGRKNSVTPSKHWCQERNYVHKWGRSPPCIRKLPSGILLSIAGGAGRKKNGAGPRFLN